MTSLLMKDVYVLMKQLRVFFVALLILMLAGEEKTMPFMAMLFAVLPMTAVAYDEQSKWNNYAIMLPYSKSSLVLSKFILGYIGIFICIFVTSSMGLLMGVVKTGTISLNVDVSLLILVISIALILLAVNLLVSFKFGVEKGRIVFIFSMILFGASGNIVKDLGESFLIRFIFEQPVVFFVIAIVVNLVSIVLAIRSKNLN